METSQKFKTIRILKMGAVATIIMKRRLERPQHGPGVHWELAEAFSRLRSDNDVRVIVLTGVNQNFLPPPEGRFFRGAGKKLLLEPKGSWLTFTGLIRCHQTMAEIEKPIIARVNGDAIGFGQSLALASDIIVAREDAVFADSHLAVGELVGAGSKFGLVPGDGGCALLPLYFTPAMAKESILLAKKYTAKQLVDLGIINYAVPSKNLDFVTEQITKRFLKRSAYALAWAKRVSNRLIVQQLNMTLDAGAAYEMVNLLQQEAFGGRTNRTLG